LDVPGAPFSAARTRTFSRVRSVATTSFSERGSTRRMNADVNVKAIAPDSHPPASLPKTIVRLGWVSFLTDVSSEIIFPLVPAFLKGLPGSPALALGFIEGIADATASFVKIASGRAADRATAKKPLVLVGYGLS